MSNAPEFNIDPIAFAANPYPTLKQMQVVAPIAYVPQLGATLLTKRSDIFTCEKNTTVFSSHQPGGLMNVLMGHNLMRKDGADHLAERKAIFPTTSPRTVHDHWAKKFRTHTERILDTLPHTADLVHDYAMPVAAEALKDITGLTNMDFRDMDRWSQAMIDGIANYANDPIIEARCHAATAGIDATIGARIADGFSPNDQSLLAVTIRAGMPMDSIRANIKLTISGGQNEPRDAIAGAAWALLNHPDQPRTNFRQVLEEYVRWISPIGMSPRRIDCEYSYNDTTFTLDDRVFLMFSAANRDPDTFTNPDVFDVRRDTSKHIAFGAGPHFCAGAAASRTLIADIALPLLFQRYPKITCAGPAPFNGWAFRGPSSVPIRLNT